MEIHQRLRAMRLQYNFKQEYLASRLGISQQAYANIEKGRTRLHIDTLENIAAVYRIKVSILFNVVEGRDLTGAK